MFKTILGIETSCDETGAAVLTNNNERITILSNIVSSSARLQEKYGGVLPEQAAREQVKMIIPVIEQALIQSNLYTPSSKNHFPSSTIYRPAIDAIAVTYGPGLIGSLLVGVETAKTLALTWNKPLIPINHLLGHFYANWIIEGSKTPSFPAIGLLVSGGHTDLVLFKSHTEYKYLGGTRDDAAGECFDKCARLLGFPYPGGPQIAKLALQGDALRFNLPRPMIDSKNFDFSFSGLKTAFANLLKDCHVAIAPRNDVIASKAKQSSALSNLAASLEQAIVDALVAKTVQAVQKYKVKQIIVAGGVGANTKLREDLRIKIYDLRINAKLHIPPASLCTDNAAMIASRAFFEKPIDPSKLEADPSLSLEVNLTRKKGAPIPSRQGGEIVLI